MPSPPGSSPRYFDPAVERRQIALSDEFDRNIGQHVAVLQKTLQQEHNNSVARREGPLWTTITRLQEENQHFRQQLQLPCLEKRCGSCLSQQVSGPELIVLASSVYGAELVPQLAKGLQPIVPSRTSSENDPVAEKDEDVRPSKKLAFANGVEETDNHGTASSIARKGTAFAILEGEETEENEEPEMFELWPDWLIEGKTQADKISSDAARTTMVMKQSVEEAQQLADEMERLDKPQDQFYPGFVVSPSNNCLIFWNVAFMFVLTYDLLMIPMGAFALPSTAPWQFFTLFCMLFWSFDLVLTANCAFYTKDGVVKFARSQIWCHYLKGWFAPDIVLVLIDWLEYSGVDAGGGMLRGGRAVKALRALRVLRILRMRKLKEVLQQFDEYINSPYFTIICSMVLNIAAILMISHFLGCFWFVIGSTAVGGYPSWVQWYDEQDSDWEYQYLTSLHWSLTQFTPGSMHVQPQNIPERAFAIIVLVSGMIIFSSIVSSITAATNGLKSMNVRYKKAIYFFRRMCREQDVKLDLIKRISRYSETFIQPRMSRVNLDEVEVMKMLPKTFQMEVFLEVYGRHLIVHPLFVKLGERTALATVCGTSISEVFLDTSEKLFSPGEKAHSMHFVTQGLLSYCVLLGNPNAGQCQEEELVTQLVKVHEWVGEAVLWTPWVYQGCMAAQSPALLMELNSLRFRECLGDHRVEWSMMKKYGKEYVRGMNDLAGFFTVAEDDDSNLSDVLVIDSAIEMLSSTRPSTFAFGSADSGNGPKAAPSTPEKTPA